MKFIKCKDKTQPQNQGNLASDANKAISKQLTSVKESQKPCKTPYTEKMAIYKRITARAKHNVVLVPHKKNV